MIHRRCSLAAPLLVGVVALVACGDDTPKGASGDTTSSSATASTTSTTTSSMGGSGGEGTGGITTDGGGGSGTGGDGTGGDPGTGGAPPSTHTLVEPVYDKSLPDPHVIKVGNAWHAYGTSSGGRHITHLKSTDLQTWKVVGDALPTVNTQWIDGAAPMTWAPAIAEIDATHYVLYYAAHVKGTEKRHCLGRGLANGPDGPFVDSFDNPLVCVDPGHWSIDPSPFVDTDGTRYLYWRQDNGTNGNSHVAVRKMGAGGQQFATGSSTKIILDHTNGSWEDSPDPDLGDLIENPAMIKMAGTYWLFYSGSSWQTTHYSTGYAKCQSPTGPCTKFTKNAPWFSTSDPNAPWMSPAGQMKGPGGFDLFEGPGGKTWASWHGWVDKVEANGGTRQLFVAPFSIKNDKPKLDKPIVAD